MAAVMLLLLLNACDKSEDAGNEIRLDSFGPMAFRGGTIKFIGNNLDKVTAIVLPVNVEIPAASFKTKTSALIEIDLPDEAVKGGFITLKTPKGDIVTKTVLNILEPITIASVSPASVRPGGTITITGTYLNLISSVTFAEGKEVTSFDAQSRTSLTVTVPADAQTGKLTLADGEVIPNTLQTTEALAINLPVITSITPNPAKAGTKITITGTDLDLANSIIFAGNKVVTKDAFTDQSETKIEVTVPGDAQNGKASLTAASLVQSASPLALSLVLPAITGVTPNPAKPGSTVTVTGTNLDLINLVTFGGGKTATAEAGGTVTEIKVKIPVDATSAAVVFGTQANNPEPVKSAELSMIKPVITVLPPTSPLDEQITITGTDLDIVKEIKFSGGTKVTITSSTATQIIVNVPLGTTTGAVTLVAKNGDEVISSGTLTILAEVPIFAAFPEWAKPGAKITLTGTKLNLTNEVIFPGDKKATRFGDRTTTSLEVYVPDDVTIGTGKITFTTYGTDITESSNVKFSYIDPVVDPNLIINNFDESGHDLGWDNWGSNLELGADAAVGITGKYAHGVKTGINGWGWIWGCNHGQLPKKTVTKAGYLFKMDVKITKALPADAMFEMELGGTRINLGNLGGTSTHGEWVTVTYDLSTFSALPATIPDSGEWGININPQNGAVIDITGLYFDNIRFEAK